MNSIRLFTFAEGNRNIKIRGRCWCWGGGPFIGEELAGTGSEAETFYRWVYRLSEIPRTLCCRWYVVPSNDTSKETSGKSRCMQRNRRWKRDRLWCSNWILRREVWNGLKEYDICKHKILLVVKTVAPVYFLSSRISNKNIDYRPGDKSWTKCILLKIQGV